MTSPIFTRLLSTSEFGVVSIYNSLLTMFTILATLNLSAGVFNNGMTDYKKDRDRLSFSFLVLGNIITIIIFSVVFIFFEQLRPILQIDKTLTALLFVTLMFQPALSFWSTRQRFEYRYKLSGFVSVAISFFSPLVAVICIHVFDNAVYSRLFGGASVQITVYLTFYILLAYKAKGKIKISYWKYALAFNLPLIPHYLSGYVLSVSNRLLISYFIDESHAGFYSLAFSIAAIVAIIWNAANVSLLPYTYEKCEKKQYGDISKVTIPIVALYALACCFVMLFGPEVMAIMAPKSYLVSLYAIPAIVAGTFFSSLYFIFANIVFYYKKPKFVMFASVISAVANLALNFMLIPRFGFLVAGYVSLACYILQALLDYIAMRLVLKEKVYNMKLIVLIAAGVLAAFVLSSVLYGYPVLRYIFIGLLLASAVLMRKRIISIVRNMKFFNNSGGLNEN